MGDADADILLVKNKLMNTKDMPSWDYLMNYAVRNDGTASSIAVFFCRVLHIDCLATIPIVAQDDFPAGSTLD